MLLTFVFMFVVRIIGRDTQLSFRSQRTKHRSLFSRPKRLYVLPISHHALPSVIYLRLIVPALWRTYSPNTNYGLLSNIHKAPILDLQWSLFSPLLYTSSADQTINITDLTTGQRNRRLRAHRGIINSLDRTIAGGAGVELLVSGSDDGTVRVWEGGDEGGKVPVAVFEVGCPVTSVCWSSDGANIYAGALDNEIHVCLIFVFVCWFDCTSIDLNANFFVLILAVVGLGVGSS